jgi:hypothetical protein
MENQNLVVQDIQPMPKKYHPPKLVEYGSLTELTKAGGGGATDGIPASLAG